MTMTRREQIAAHEAELHMLWRRAHRLQLYHAQYGINAEPASDLINFICDVPLKSGFWTPQDDTNLTNVLHGAAPQACGTSRP